MLLGEQGAARWDANPGKGLALVQKDGLAGEQLLLWTAGSFLVAFVEELATQLGAGKGSETSSCISCRLALISVRVAAIIEAFHWGRAIAWQLELGNWDSGFTPFYSIAVGFWVEQRLLVVPQFLLHAGNAQLRYEELQIGQIFQWWYHKR